MNKHTKTRKLLRPVKLEPKLKLKTKPKMKSMMFKMKQKIQISTTKVKQRKLTFQYMTMLCYVTQTENS